MNRFNTKGKTISQYPSFSELPSIVFYRSVILLLVFSNVIMGLVGLTDIMPYKYEEHDGTKIRVGLWRVCVWKNGPPVKRCFDGYYKDNAEEWFNSFRALITLGVIVLGLSFCHLVLLIFLTKNESFRNYMWSAVAALFSAICIFIAQVLYHGYFPFDFLGDIREQGLGWTEETSQEEYHGENYYFTWATICFCLLNSVLCIILHKQDRLFTLKCRNKSFPRSNQYLMQPQKNGNSQHL